MMLLLFVVKSIQAETEVPTLYNLHSVLKMNLTVKERSRTPKKLLHYCMSVRWMGSFIWNFDPRCRAVSEENFRQKASNHEMTSDKYKNKAKFSTTFCRQKKNKEKTSIKIGPRTVSFMESTLCLPRCSWLSDTSIELYCVT